MAHLPATAAPSKLESPSPPPRPRPSVARALRRNGLTGTPPSHRPPKGRVDEPTAGRGRRAGDQWYPTRRTIGNRSAPASTTGRRGPPTDAPRPTQTPAPPAGQAAEHLKVKLRPDLVVQPQFYEGMTHYVVKDPIALKYFRFKQEEYFLLQQLDGKHTLQDVKRTFERKYRPQTIAVDDLLRFAAQLHEAGLILVDTPEQAKVLIKRRRKNQWKRFGQFFANILYLKIPLDRPRAAPELDVPVLPLDLHALVHRRQRRLMLAALTLVFVAVGHLPGQAARVPELLQLAHHPLLLVQPGGRQGHPRVRPRPDGQALRRRGPRDGHALPRAHPGAVLRRDRLAGSCPASGNGSGSPAAGIYVECFLASLATFVWWNTEPGLLNSLMLATMFICSVNTILFNANPLLRYDGYYVMSDYLEIPNLRIKSTQFFAYLFQEKVLGLEVPVQSYMPRSRRALFVTYAIASYLYRWFITFSIIFFLYQFLSPRSCGRSATFLALGSLVPLLVMPLYQIFKFVRQPGRMRKVKKARAAAFFAAVGGDRRGDPADPHAAAGQGDAGPDARQTRARSTPRCPGRLVELEVRDSEPVTRRRDRHRHAVQPRRTSSASAKQLQMEQQHQPRQVRGLRPAPPSIADRQMARQFAEHARGPPARAREGHRADRQAEPLRRPRRRRHGRAPPRDDRPVARARRAVLRGRRPRPSWRPTPDRPVRRRPDLKGGKPRAWVKIYGHSMTDPPQPRRRDRPAQPRGDPARTLQPGRRRDRHQARPEDRRGPTR